MSQSTNTALRLIHCLQLIPRQSTTCRRKIGARELLKQLKALGHDISLRSLQRDLKKLAGTFPGLCNDGNRDALGWYWAEDSDLLDIPAMNPAMALSFKLAEKFLGPVMPAQLEALRPYLDAARKALGNDNGWLDRIHVEPRSMPLIPARIDPAVLDSVHSALIEQRRLRARYRPRDGGPAEYELNPLGLVLRNEVTYLVATAWEFSDPRHYALHRFDGAHIELLEKAATPPGGFDLESYLRSASFQYRLGEQAMPIRLLMQRATAHHLAETPLSDDQIIEECDPPGAEWVSIRATVADSLQLRWWLLGLGDQVIVEAPGELRGEIADILRGAAARYED
jgi:predicted DNA-binding transcriptional regulator YafY